MKNEIEQEKDEYKFHLTLYFNYQSIPSLIMSYKGESIIESISICNALSVEL